MLRRKRKQEGKNTGKNFTEGWVEFEDKAVAKRVGGWPATRGFLLESIRIQTQVAYRRGLPGEGGGAQQNEVHCYWQGKK